MEKAAARRGSRHSELSSKSCLPGLQDEDGALGKDLGDPKPLQVVGGGWILTSVSALLPLDEVLMEQEVGQKRRMRWC